MAQGDLSRIKAATHPWDGSPLSLFPFFVASSALHLRLITPPP
jgi:hypothetical protein